MREQLENIAVVAERIKNVSSSINGDGQRQEGSRSEEALNKRLELAKKRQQQLVQRYSSVRNKISKLGGRPLSDKEKAWVGEVNTLSSSIEKVEVTDQEQRETLRQRLETVRQPFST
jgi:nucleoporin NUP82